MQPTLRCALYFLILLTLFTQKSYAQVDPIKLLTELRIWVELPPDLKALDNTTVTPWLAFKDRTPTWSSCKRYVAAGFPCTPLPPTE
jgi:hypothetical protein